MTRQINTFFLLLLLGTVNQSFGQQLFQFQKIVASDRSYADNFGYSSDLDSIFGIVGAVNEDHDINGNNFLTASGSAYIFEKSSGGNWIQVSKICANDRNSSDNFGHSVGISGEYAIVGAKYEDQDTSGLNTLSNAGSAYIFKRNLSGNWTQVQKLVASDRQAGDEFGYAVSISGNYAIVTARMEAHDVAGNNSKIAAGSAYIFKRDNFGVWHEVQKITANDRHVLSQFGYSASISDSCAVIGTNGEGYDENGANQLSNAGAAYVFELNGTGIWTQTTKLVALDRSSNDIFGSSVAIDNETIVVGATNEDEDSLGLNTILEAGSVYVFEKNNLGIWQQKQKLNHHDRAFSDYFGFSVSVSGDIILAGSWNQDYDVLGNNLMSNAGAAYVFLRDSNGYWRESQKITADDRSADDDFGGSASVSQGHILVTASLQDTDENGGNYASAAGACYIYEECSPSSSVQNIISCNSYTSPSGNYTWTISGVYSDTLPNRYACDSIITIDLTINNSNAGSETVTSCDSYTWPADGNTYSSTGAYTTILTNASGCDSVATLNLTITNSNAGSETITSCDSYTWPADGNTYNSTGAYTTILTNASGCDSVATMNLTITNSNAGSETITSCDSYTWPADGNTYNSTGAYTTILTNAAGCDSVVTLNLTINTVSDITTSVNGVTVLANNPGATCVWLDCDAGFAIIPEETNQSYTPAANGNYAVQLSENGCLDTSACVEITTIGMIENDFGNGLMIYPNPTNGNFVIDLGSVYNSAEISIYDINGKLIRSSSFGKKQILRMSLEEPAGIYLMTITAGDRKAAIRLVKE